MDQVHVDRHQRAVVLLGVNANVVVCKRTTAAGAARRVDVSTREPIGATSAAQRTKRDDERRVRPPNDKPTNKQRSCTRSRHTGKLTDNVAFDQSHAVDHLQPNAGVSWLVNRDAKKKKQVPLCVVPDGCGRTATRRAQTNMQQHRQARRRKKRGRERESTRARKTHRRQAAHTATGAAVPTHQMLLNASASNETKINATRTARL
jgi:hypothetical protein